MANSKKNALDIAMMMQSIHEASIREIAEATVLGDEITLEFDAECDSSAPLSRVIKTTQRTLFTLKLGRVKTRSIIREDPSATTPRGGRSALLDTLAPSGARYGFDLIAYIGIESYLRGRSLKDLQYEFNQRKPSWHIATSSLSDQQQKFLFYLGAMHQQASPRIASYLAERGSTHWLLDGTIEPGTPVLFGIQDAISGISLASWTIPSENTDHIVPCLQQAAGDFGNPDGLLHDLSQSISAACDEALQGVRHGVCHYHLASDVGEDLCGKPQTTLTKRMRALEVQYRLRQQRRGQSEWFRKEPSAAAQDLVEKLLNRQPLDVPFNHALGREVLMALHFWILDYRSDGQHRGFPFDPYTLYLHRRLVRTAEALNSLLSISQVARKAPPALLNLDRQLQAYQQDPEIQAAAMEYEDAYSMFNRLRNALRLTARQITSLRQVEELPPEEQRGIHKALTELREELRAETTQNSGRGHARIVLKHLDKYWVYLQPAPSSCVNPSRTITPLEKTWRTRKCRRRQAHGRSKLTLDFNSIPAEYMLTSNLENPVYIDLVLDGSLDTLPDKLASASRMAGPYQAWRRRVRPKLVGQLPRRLLRQDNFIEELISNCIRHCINEN